MHSSKPHIAIIYSFNDRTKHKYGSRRGLKEEIGYFDQFLVSRQSIIDTWKQDKFSYDFHIVCSDSFSNEKMEYLTQLGVSVICVGESANPFLRTLALTADIKCDFKLILDNDTFAIDQPSFDFSKDVLAMFGGCRFNSNRIDLMCKHLNIDRPVQEPKHDGLGVFYNDYEYGDYYSPNDPGTIFPYFNGGAILIKKEISKEVGKLIISFIPKIGKRVWGYQDLIGVAINHVTKNWAPFEKGFNFLINPNLPNIRRVMESYPGKISLIHYINSSSHFPKYYNLVKETYKKVKFEN